MPQSAELIILSKSKLEIRFQKIKKRSPHI